MVKRNDTRSRKLYQFTLSHYCEKTRWNLDWKQLDWQAVNLLPGPHIPVAWWQARQRTLPILVDGKRAIGDSTAIALYMEQHYPEYPLLPADNALRQQVLALEAFFDELGEDVRRCVWSLAIDSKDMDRLFFHGYSPRQQQLGRWMRPALRQMLRHTFSIRPRQVEASWQAIFAAIRTLEDQLQNDAGRYLAGDHFTLADLTAASMLAPLTGPPGSPWADQQLPEDARTTYAGLRHQLRHGTVGQWLNRLYATHRQ